MRYTYYEQEKLRPAKGCLIGLLWAVVSWAAIITLSIFVIKTLPNHISPFIYDIQQFINNFLNQLGGLG